MLTRGPSGLERDVELTVESLIGELGLELAAGSEPRSTHVRWVHGTELADPTPWL